MIDEEKKCSLCFYSEAAKGLSDHLYCTKNRDYRPFFGKTCKHYFYDIIKVPVRRKKSFKIDRNLNFDI